MVRTLTCKTLGQPRRRAPPRPCRTQFLDQGVQAIDAIHGRSVDARGDSSEIHLPRAFIEHLAPWNWSPSHPAACRRVRPRAFTTAIVEPGTVLGTSRLTRQEPPSGEVGRFAACVLAAEA